MTQPLDLFRTMILPAAVVSVARDIAAFSGQNGMWPTPLSASGKDPATHYIDSGLLRASIAQMLPLQTWEKNDTGVWIKTASTPGQAQAVQDFLQQRGVALYTLAQIEAMMAAADVTDQPPFTAMERLNLQMINTKI